LNATPWNVEVEPVMTIEPPDYVIDTERLEPYIRQGVNAGYRQIPARFTPGPRRGADISSLSQANTEARVRACPGR
jgi:hypothetical protein